MNSNPAMCRLVCLLAVSRCYNSAPYNLKKLIEKMPKEMKHAGVLKKQRQKLKEKGQKYIPGIVTLKVLGSGAKGAARSLYVFTDQSKYLFNCGEGTQRLAHEHKMKLSKLEHIFITHRSWENIGGLPGVALTIQDVGVPEITVHGPKGTNDIFKATRRFIVLRDLEVRMAECSPDKHFQDNVMRVLYVPISSTKAEVSDTTRSETNRKEEIFTKTFTEDDDVDYYAHERKRKIIHTRDDAQRKQQHTEVIQTNESAENNFAMCYICKLHPRPGTLDLQKCVERGVTPGPLLGKLKSGEDIVLKDGTVVYSADVRDPDDPGPVFIVVECPTEDYIDSLVNSVQISQHQALAAKEEDIAAIVVHFTPPKVMNLPKYKNWMEKFSLSTQHLILNEENQCMGSVAVHRIQYKLNLLHPKIFPLLEDKSIESDDLSEEASSKNEVFNNTINSESSKLTNCSSENVCCFRGRTFCSVHLRPRKMWDKDSELKMSPKLFIEETYNAEGFSDALSELKQKIQEVGESDLPKHRYPLISFLGTGSCIPNKTRNTSGILLQISDEESILLDCGEGTYGQIVRLFGSEKADGVLLGLKAIFVSHLHADHHLGLISLLKARKKVAEKYKKMGKPIFLIAPQQIMSWLSLYHWNFEPITQDILLVPNAQLDLNNSVLNEEVKKRVLETLNMSKINTVQVKHCPNAFGVAFEHKENWKLTYSGDTMPCSQLVDLGQGSDVLIHEATMEDELLDEACIKLHSTTSQAIEIGRKMNAKFILLTHFSQRYSKIPIINDNFSQNVGIAFDNMQVSFHQLPLLPLLHSALKIMFAERYDEMELKTYRRLMKRT